MRSTARRNSRLARFSWMPRLVRRIASKNSALSRFAQPPRFAVRNSVLGGGKLLFGGRPRLQLGKRNSTLGGRGPSGERRSLFRRPALLRVAK